MTDREALAGALVGVARACDGSAQPTEETFRAIFQGLKAYADESLDGAALEEMTEKLHDAKFALVSECRTCLNPCGHHDDLDMDLLDAQGENVRKKKLYLLDRLAAMAPAAEGKNDVRVNRFFCEALFMLGYAQRAEDLEGTLERLTQMERGS